MDGLHGKSLRSPDESIELPGLAEVYVELGGYTVGRSIQQPGWRYSRDMAPITGAGPWCEAHHMGVVLSGRWGAELRDGSTMEFGPDDVYDCPPGHDGFTVGDEPCVMIEWAGLRTHIGALVGSHSRVLRTLMFTDLVGSTTAAARAGDAVWHERLERHYQLARAELERAGGLEVTTTGDGMLATFDGPAQALRCAAALRDVSARDGLHVRIGVHVGEVELVGSDVRGLAVHEAARIMGAAGPDEVLVSELTRALCEPAGLAFDDRGVRELKGLEGERRLFAYRSEGDSRPNSELSST